VAVRQDAVLDTSVLLNFLKVDRLDLLGRHPAFRFVITDHVRSEIKDHYEGQIERLEAAIENGWLTEIRVFEGREVEMFAELGSDGRLGAGECSAISVSSARGIPIAIDDVRARKKAEEFVSDVVGTADLMIGLIRAGVIDVAGADAVKRRWERDERFTLPFESFGGLIGDSAGEKEVDDD
jgi:predicted nucleic acid-binding protein